MIFVPFVTEAVAPPDNGLLSYSFSASFPVNSGVNVIVSAFVIVNVPGVVFTTTLSVTSTPSFSTIAVPSNTVFVYSPTSVPLVTVVNPDTV